MTDTKQKIMQAATRLFAAEGYNGVSIRDISRAADVNLGAVNYHFQSKEQLYMEVIRSYFDKMCTRLTELASDQDVESYIRHFVEHHFRMMSARDPEMEQIVCRELSNPSERRDRLTQEFLVPVHQSLIEVIRRGIQAGRFRDVDPDLTAFSLVGMCVFFANKRDMLGRIMGGGTDTPEFQQRVVNHTVELFLTGIRESRMKDEG